MPNRARLAAAPTANAEAYRLYLQGREYCDSLGYLRQNIETAQQLFERALALDPNFALAHAALSQVHGRMYWFRYDPSAARAARQREEAEAALRLAPDLPQAHIAMGFAYYCGPHATTAGRWTSSRSRSRDCPMTPCSGRGSGLSTVGWATGTKVVAAFEKAAQLDPRERETFSGISVA